jgi:CheY-like chemotaxis protein
MALEAPAEASAMQMSRSRIQPVPAASEPPAAPATLGAASTLNERRLPTVSPSQAKIRAALGGRHLLLAEDNATNRMIYSKYLEKCGARLSLAKDGAAAIELFRATRPHLILMDVSMPVMSGFTATREVRRIELSQNLPRCPIIALTAHRFTEDHERSRAAGMDGVLLKPVSKAQLLATIIEALEDSSTATARIHA